MIRCHLLKKSSSNTMQKIISCYEFWVLICTLSDWISSSQTDKFPLEAAKWRGRIPSSLSANPQRVGSKTSSIIFWQLLLYWWLICDTLAKACFHQRVSWSLPMWSFPCGCMSDYVRAVSGCTVDSPWISFHIRLYQKIHPGTALPIAARNGLDGLVSSSSQLASALAISKCMQHLK